MRIKPEESYRGLSRMLDILYSKFWAATMISSVKSVSGTRRNRRRTKRVQELLSVFALESDDFTASTANIGVDVECLPKMINGADTRHGPDVKEDANVGLKNGAKSVKEPAM